MRIVTALFALLVVSVSAATCQAQWFPAGIRPVRSVDRWLGIGWSSGYHWRNPGPDTDYYNPYGEQNQSTSGFNSVQYLGTRQQSNFQDPGLTVSDNSTFQSSSQNYVARSILENTAQPPSLVGHVNSNGVVPTVPASRRRESAGIKGYVSPFANHHNQ